MEARPRPPALNSMFATSTHPMSSSSEREPRERRTDSERETVKERDSERERQ